MNKWREKVRRLLRRFLTSDTDPELDTHSHSFLLGADNSEENLEDKPRCVVCKTDDVNCTYFPTNKKTFEGITIENNLRKSFVCHDEKSSKLLWL